MYHKGEIDVQRLSAQRLLEHPRDLVHVIDDTERGSTPLMTTRDRKLVYVLEDKNRAQGSNPRPLNPRSITQVTLPSL